MEERIPCEKHENLIKKSFVGSVTVGERGQMVIPVEARHKLGLMPGDKLLAFVNPLNNGLFLIKASAFESLQRFIDLLLKELTEK